MKVLQQVNLHINQIDNYQPGRPIEDVARELGLDENDILKLASNENALGVSPLAKKAMKKAIDNVYRYPDGDAIELKASLAKHLNYKKENFIIGAGSNEILVFLSQCFMRKGKSIIASEKAFIIYKILAQISNCQFHEIPMKGLTHDLDAMLDAIDETTSMIFICNPNNPTGTMIDGEKIADFMAKVPDDVLVVFDEAYAEICLKKMPNTLQYIKQNRPVIILRSFSKAYGLAGLRVGYGIANDKIIAVLEKVRQPFNTTIMGQKAATASLQDTIFLQKSRQLYTQAKQYIEKSFQELKINYEPTVTNFILFEVDNVKKINQKLTENGIIVRPMKAYNLPNHLRITFGTKQQNERFIETLKKII